MMVGFILQRKGSDVATIPRTSTVSVAADHLTTRRIGALVVSDDGQMIDGIISERDIVRAVAHHGPSVLMHTVSEIMSTPVLTCRLDDTVDSLMALMTERRVRHLPVVANGALVGLVSIGDIVKYRVDELQTETKVLLDYISNGR